MMRRRQERMLEDQIDANEDYMEEELKPGETSPLGSLNGEYTPSNMGISQEPDVEANMQQKVEERKSDYTGDTESTLQEKQEDNDSESIIQKKREGESSERSPVIRQRGEEHQRYNQTENTESGMLACGYHGEDSAAQLQDAVAGNQFQKQKAMLDKSQKAKMYENLRYLENPRILELSGILFADHSSVWSGRHSLVQPKGFTPRSSIGAAIEMLMK